MRWHPKAFDRNAAQLAAAPAATATPAAAAAAAAFFDLHSFLLAAKFEICEFACDFLLL